jgi:hypothetical protein
MVSVVIAAKSRLNVSKMLQLFVALMQQAQHQQMVLFQLLLQMANVAQTVNVLANGLAQQRLLHHAQSAQSSH